jgi:hypothetical protein
MGCPSEVEIGDNLTFSITTHDPDTGIATDADSVPTYRIYEESNETAILSGNIDDGTGPADQFDNANTTGFYVKTVACTSGNGFENGKSYTIEIEATVGGDKGGISYGFKAYDYRKSDVRAMGGSAQSATDLKQFADSCYDDVNNWVNIDPAQPFDGVYAGGTLGKYIQTINTNMTAVVGYTYDWVDGQRMDLILDQILALSGEDAFTGTLTVDDGATGLEGAVVNIRRGGVLKAWGTTDSAGEITDWVFGNYTYDIAVRLAGYEPKTDTMTISADSWTKTVSLTAIAISAPSAATLCTVQFRVKLSDTAVSGAVCKAKLQGINQASDGTILSNEESSDTTDAQGVAELQLVRKGSIVKGSGIYKIWVEIDGKPVSNVKTTIPNQSTILFEDLLT